jgi:putative membrane protein
MPTKELLDEGQIERLNRAVAEGQARTAARIVPVVAQSSGRYDRAEELVGLWAAALALAMMWLFFAKAPIGRELDTYGQVWSLGLLPVFAVIALGFIAGALIATQVGWLKRLFVPRRSLAAAAVQSARGIFNERRLKANPDVPFLLIYVSVYERQACIVADESLETAIGSAETQKFCDPIIAALKEGNLADGIFDSIRLCADALANLFPADYGAPAPAKGPVQPTLTVLM